MAPPKALLILADGAEEMETVITADILRRGEVDVTIAGLESSKLVKCSRQVQIQPDTSLDEAIKHRPYDLVVMPGGMGGARSLAASAKVGEILKEQEKAGRLIAAICAAPIALKSHGIAKGKKVTSHPSVKKEMEDGDYHYLEDRVVQDGAVVTSRGPGTAHEFGVKLVEVLRGKQVADEVKKPMILNF